jgi:hypothetical protein
MRLPIKEKEKDFKLVKILNSINNDLRDSFEITLKKDLETVNIKVMLADFTIIQTNTFDPNKILNFFFNKEKEISKLKNYKIVPVQLTKTDDLHRIFFQLSIEIEKFYFLIYMGIQFHALLYYKPDKEVINIYKRIRQLEEINFDIKKEISKRGDLLIQQELEKLGYKEISNTELFEELFTKQDLSERLSHSAVKVEESFPQLKQNTKLIETLKKDLENFTIEIYQINQASIDSNKIMIGEEGIAFNMDFELIKNKKTRERTSVIDFDKIYDKDILKITQTFSSLINIFKNND